MPDAPLIHFAIKPDGTAYHVVKWLDPAQKRAAYYARDLDSEREARDVAHLFEWRQVHPDDDLDNLLPLAITA